MRAYAQLGQWTFRWDKKDSRKLAPISLTKHRCQKVLSTAALANKTLVEFVTLALDGGDDPEEVKVWLEFLKEYLGAMDMLTQSSEYVEGDIDKMQKMADRAFKIYVEKIAGSDGVTNYFHFLGAGHFSQMAKIWGNLMRFRNEGAEAKNGDITQKYLKGSNKGGHKGRAKKRRRIEPAGDAEPPPAADEAGDSNTLAGVVEGIGRWCARSYMWASKRAGVLFAGASWLLQGEGDEDDSDAAAYETESDEEVDDDGEYDEFSGTVEDEEAAWLVSNEGAVLGKRTRGGGVF
jgi:hypothetical protein